MKRGVQNVKHGKRKKEFGSDVTRGDGARC